jgi:RecA-family ATPase
MMVAIPNLDSAAPAANDNKPMPPSERAAFISMIQEKAALNRPVAVADDSIDAETLLGMEFPPLEYVIPGYVVEGLTVLAGKPKLGKSWWCYDAGIAVATGGKAMGAIDCEQGDVLYLALEDNRRRVQDRLLTLCPARKVQGINLKRLTVRTATPRIDTGLLAQLDKWRLGCERPRLIIIDVFLKVRPPRKKGEDPYSADYDAVTPLQRYASEHRLAIVLVTHTRKMAADDPLEAVSGTNGVTGAADAVLVLNRDAKGTTLYGRGRDIEEIETAMRFDAGRWSILGDADEVRKSNERRKILPF